jgi:hypothetical protein
MQIVQIVQIVQIRFEYLRSCDLVEALSWDIGRNTVLIG